MFDLQHALGAWHKSYKENTLHMKCEEQKEADDKLWLKKRHCSAANIKMYKIECDIIFCYYIINFFLNTTIFIIKISTWYHRICMSVQCDR